MLIRKLHVIYYHPTPIYGLSATVVVFAFMAVSSAGETAETDWRVL